MMFISQIKKVEITVPKSLIHVLTSVAFEYKSMSKRLRSRNNEEGSEVSAQPIDRDR